MIHIMLYILGCRKYFRLELNNFPVLRYINSSQCTVLQPLTFALLTISSRCKSSSCSRLSNSRCFCISAVISFSSCSIAILWRCSNNDWLRMDVASLQTQTMSPVSQFMRWYNDHGLSQVILHNDNTRCCYNYHPKLEVFHCKSYYINTTVIYSVI